VRVLLYYKVVCVRLFFSFNMEQMKFETICTLLRPPATTPTCYCTLVPLSFTHPPHVLTCFFVRWKCFFLVTCDCVIVLISIMGKKKDLGVYIVPRNRKYNVCGCECECRRVCADERICVCV
jgi:hypothetical protein